MKTPLFLLLLIFPLITFAAEVDISEAGCPSQILSDAGGLHCVDTTPPPPPPTDTDGDGIPDESDACPFDPGPASNGGCPISGGGGELPTAPNSIAALGCSNSEQHVIGYQRRSAIDKISNATFPLGGLTFNDWANLNGPAWSRMGPGYQAVWLQLCMRNDEHNGAMTAEHQAKLADILGKLQTDYGIAPENVWISGLNELTNACWLTAPDGDEVGRAIADWSAQNLGTNRGPDTATDSLAGDNCHLSWQGGIQEVGQQMVEFFD